MAHWKHRCTATPAPMDELPQPIHLRKPMRPGLEHLPQDANGCPIEHISSDGLDIVIHYEDIPDKDLATVRGLPVTTPLRTVIDLAAELDEHHLMTIVADCLDRRLFTLDEARARLDEDDIKDRAGAIALRRLLIERW